METTTKTTTAAAKPAPKLLTEASAYELLRQLENLTYSLPEAAKLAKMDPRQMRALCRENKLTATYKLFDDAWLISRVEFDAWLKARGAKLQEEKALRVQLEQLQAKMEELKATRATGTKG